MRTLTEHLHDQQDAEQAEAERIASVYQELQNNNIPLYAGISPMQRACFREGLKSGYMKQIGYTCDYCRTELVYCNPHIQLQSNPPQYHVGCPGCGWRGTTTI
jgi:hypothetical protein